MLRKILALLMLLCLLVAPAFATEVLVDGDVAVTDELLVEYGYDYIIPEEVALYLHAFCELPPNYLTKDEAYDLGWNSREGNLWDVAYGCAIGGDEFGNREGILPKARGRQYYECDVNYFGGFREAERIVFSNDGLIFYTDDHYETFEMLYEYWYYAGVEYVPYAYNAYSYGY